MLRDRLSGLALEETGPAETGAEETGVDETGTDRDPVEARLEERETDVEDLEEAGRFVACIEEGSTSNIGETSASLTETSLVFSGLMKGTGCNVVSTRPIPSILSETSSSESASGSKVEYAPGFSDLGEELEEQ